LLARELKQQIFAHTQLTASAGVSFNKFLAKLASDYQKPDGLTVVTPQQADRFLSAMPVRKFFGVGKVTADAMASRGILIGADLRQQTEAQLSAWFGERGALLYHYARGEDERAVESQRRRKSVGKETTFAQDITAPAQLLSTLAQLADQVERRLVELGVGGKTVTLKVKWDNFQQITRRITVPVAMQQAETMLPHLRLLLEEVAAEHRPVRLLGVTIAHLVPWKERSHQQALFNPSLWVTDEE
jgi:DNA polymerase-4